MCLRIPIGISVMLPFVKKVEINAKMYNPSSPPLMILREKIFTELRWRIIRGLAPEVSADHGRTPVSFIIKKDSLYVRVLLLYIPYSVFKGR